MSRLQSSRGGEAVSLQRMDGSLSRLEISGFFSSFLPFAFQSFGCTMCVLFLGKSFEGSRGQDGPSSAIFCSALFFFISKPYFCVFMLMSSTYLYARAHLSMYLLAYVFSFLFFFLGWGDDFREEIWRSVRL